MTAEEDPFAPEVAMLDDPLWSPRFQSDPLPSIVRL